jgi:hypothetical protein
MRSGGSNATFRIRDRSGGRYGMGSQKRELRWLWILAGYGTNEPAVSR